MHQQAVQLWCTKLVRLSLQSICGAQRLVCLSWLSNYGAQNWCASVDCPARTHKIGGLQLAVQLWRTKLVRLSLMFNYGANKVCTSVGCPTIAHKVGAPQLAVLLLRTKLVCLSWLSYFAVSKWCTSVGYPANHMGHVSWQPNCQSQL